MEGVNRQMCVVETEPPLSYECFYRDKFPMKHCFLKIRCCRNMKKTHRKENTTFLHTYLRQPRRDHCHHSENFDNENDFEAHKNKCCIRRLFFFFVSG